MSEGVRKDRGSDVAFRDRRGLSRGLRFVVCTLMCHEFLDRGINSRKISCVSTARVYVESSITSALALPLSNRLDVTQPMTGSLF